MIIKFFMYNEKQLKHRQELVDTIEGLHKKFPNGSFSITQILKNNDLRRIFAFLLLQNERLVAAIDTNSKRSTIYERKPHQFTSAGHAMEHYASLARKGYHFYDQTTYEMFTPKALRNIVFFEIANGSHKKVRRKVSLDVDSTNYHTLPTPPHSDYEVAQDRQPFARIIKARNPITKKLTKYHLKAAYPITYLMSDRSSYKAAVAYANAIKKLSFAQWPKNQALATRLLQFMIPNFRYVVAKVQDGRSPIIYSPTLDHVLGVIRTTLLVRSNPKKNSSKQHFIKVIETWTDKISLISNSAAYNKIMASAEISIDKYRQHDLKPHIKTYNADGLKDIQLKQHFQQVSDRRKMCALKFNHPRNSSEKKYMLSMDAYLRYIPVTDKYGREMKPSEFIRVRGRKAKHIKHALHKERR